MKSTTTTNLRLLYVLSLLYGWTIALDDPVSSQDGSFSDPREHSVGVKRAYEYRSEYKRLPLFQFGLGKRMAPSYEKKRTRPLNFGLGKRKESYVFGLGKRSGYDDADGYSDELYDDSASKSYALDKRTESGFTFGLGKREGETDVDNWLQKKRLMMKYVKAEFPFGLGKRTYEDKDDDVLFAQMDSDGFVDKCH